MRLGYSGIGKDLYSLLFRIAGLIYILCSFVIYQIYFFKFMLDTISHKHIKGYLTLILHNFEIFVHVQ